MNVNMKKTALALVGLCIMAVSVAVPKGSTVDSKETKIREIMTVTGAGELGVQMARSIMEPLRQAMPEVPAEWWEAFAAEIRPDDLVDLIVPIYDRHFEEEDLDALLEFYKSPAGEKLVRLLPVITQESMAAGQQWGADLSEKLLRKLGGDGYDVSKLSS